MYQTALRGCLLAVGVIANACIPGAEAAMTTTATPVAKQSLVIIGASYAGSWGTPALPGYTVTNRGVDGEETKDMAARFQRDVVAAKPNVVLIWGHINNYTRTTPDRYGAAKAAAQEHYRQMVAAARAAGIEVILATEIPRGEATGFVNWAVALVNRLRGKTSYAKQINAQVFEVNQFIRRLAAEKRLRLLDFASVFDDGDGERPADYTLPDLSHVTPAGYAALTRYTVTELAREQKP